MLRLLALLSLLPLMAEASVKNQNPVSDVAYGNALYHFYLQEPLTALTLLAVREQQGPKKESALDALLLETLLKLDYAMVLSAKVLIEKPQVAQALKQQDALWLHLAQAFYQKHWFDLSLSALNRIEKPQRLNDYAMWLYLSAQLALQQHDIGIAQKFVKKMDNNSIYTPYIHYNVAVYEAQSDQNAAALKRLQGLIRKPSHANNELQQLQQRALITAAYVSLFNDQAEHAQAYFGQLDQNSIFAEHALMGFGQALYARQHLQAAEKVWLQLANANYSNDASINANLALGELYEQQKTDDSHTQKNALSQALQHFEAAEKLSAHYLARLDGLSTRFDAKQLAQLLTAANLNAERLKLLTEFSSLTDFLSSSDTQNQIQNLKDLQHIEQQLQAWQQQVLIMQNVSDSRITLFQQKAKIAAQQKTQFNAEGIAQDARTLREEVQKIEQQKAVFLLNNREENRLLALITRSEALLPRLADDPFIEEYQDTLRRVKGALIWQAHQHYHARLWQVKSALNALDKALLENTQRNEELNTQLLQQQQLAAHSHNVQQQAQLIQTQQQNVSALQEEALAHLQLSFAAHIKLQQQLTRMQLKNARIAIARISEHFLDEHLP